MFHWFVEGGTLVNSVLTLILFAAFVIAWKAPRWLRETGGAAIVVAVISLLTGARNMFDVLQQVGGQISPGVLYGTLKAAMIPLIYAFVIDFITIGLRLLTKPKHYGHKH